MYLRRVPRDAGFGAGCGISRLSLHGRTCGVSRAVCTGERTRVRGIVVGSVNVAMGGKAATEPTWTYLRRVPRGIYRRTDAG
jgi:hypothetical protein